MASRIRFLPYACYSTIHLFIPTFCIAAAGKTAELKAPERWLERTVDAVDQWQRLLPSINRHEDAYRSVSCFAMFKAVPSL
jgi:hypothetical protein